MTTTTFSAHVSSVIAAVAEWQRGAINWTECLRCCDVSATGQRELETLSRTSSTQVIAAAATRAVAAGN